MKGLKKIALATAVAAAPFAAQAELTALNDSAMGNVTGQAGVTIELETRVSIGQFKYTDTDTDGSFAVNDIELGGAGILTGNTKIFDVVDSSGSPGQDGTADVAATTRLDDLAIDIDLNAEGDAVIEVHSISGAPIDWGMTAGNMKLQGADPQTDNTTLISNMKAWGFLGKLNITVDTTDKGTGDGHLNVDTAFTVQDMDFDVDFLGVGVRDMEITGAGSNFDYDGDGKTLAAGTEDDGENIDGLNISQADAAAGTLSKEQKLALGYAGVNIDVYKGNGLGANTGLGASTAEDALRIDVNDVRMDINIGSVEIGTVDDGSGNLVGASIGSIALDNLSITETKLAIYGH